MTDKRVISIALSPSTPLSTLVIQGGTKLPQIIQQAKAKLKIKQDPIQILSDKGRVITVDTEIQHGDILYF